MLAGADGNAASAGDTGAAAKVRPIRAPGVYPPPSQPTSQPAKPVEKQTSMTQSQRDALIAEVLGDVLALGEQMVHIQSQLDAIGKSITANDFVRWRNTLDAKMSELAEVNLSEQAARRLQVFAQTYLTELSRETNKLITIEVKRRVADTLAFNEMLGKLNQQWLLRLGHVAGASFTGCLLALLLWHWLSH